MSESRLTAFSCFSRDRASDQARLLELEARKRDLELRIEFVTHARETLSATLASLLGGILGSYVNTQASSHSVILLTAHFSTDRP